MATANDFTMRREDGFQWMVEGNTDMLLQDHFRDGGTMEDFITEFVKDEIGLWDDPHTAKDATIYEAWRRGDEYDAILTLFNTQFASLLAPEEEAVTWEGERYLVVQSDEDGAWEIYDQATETSSRVGDEGPTRAIAAKWNKEAYWAAGGVLQERTDLV